MVGPERKRQAVLHVRGALEVSERRACKTVRQPRSTQRYHRRQCDKDAPLVAELRRISAKFPRAGYRMSFTYFRATRVLWQKFWRDFAPRPQSRLARPLPRSLSRIRPAPRTIARSFSRQAEFQAP